MTLDAGRRVFTVPPGAPFLDTVARTLLGGTLIPGFSATAGPLGLAAATIFVPTRRAARALATTLASATPGPATLLPRILPLGALEATETDLLFDEETLDDPLASDFPPAIEAIERRMILMRMVLAWAKAVRRAIVTVEPDGHRTVHPDEELLVGTSPADAWALSGDLAALSDELRIEGLDWSAVRTVDVAGFDEYWRITLDFLDIVVRQWPEILAERGEVDPAARSIALVDAGIARLKAGRWDGPVLVIGSTGSNAATARLIGAVAAAPNGAVVLPGLDQWLDEASWRAIGQPGANDYAASHPQAQLKRLLATVGITRSDVVSIGPVPSDILARSRFLSDALRPAETTDAWQRTGLADHDDLAAALGGVTLIEAADEREEALALAIALREALEGEGTAMLVTPDRLLGRRVREELSRWSVDIDESGGEPLGTTPAGALARLVVDCALQDLAPVEVLALLAHPLARLGQPRAEVTRLARTLEIAILRGVLPPRALHDPAGLIERARAASGKRHAPDALARLTPADFAALARFVQVITDALAPLIALQGEVPLERWIAAHAAAVEAIATDPAGDSVVTGLDGHALLGLFDALQVSATDVVLDGAAYAALFDRWAAETPVRGPNRSHPRLKILGLLEARLLDADLVLLGGLDEATWPPATQTDAFLNRPMRAALRLQPPERRIGQTAHDLEMAMGRSRVILSRARKRGGAPTVASRFLQRMAALGGEAWGQCRARGERFIAWAHALDRPDRLEIIARPAPKPDLARRPTRLSVTRIETLRRDPYAIYAEYILNLRPVEAIAAVVGPAEYGTAFHAVLAGHSRDVAERGASSDAAADMERRAADALAEAMGEPAFQAFLWPQLARWSRAFLAWDAQRRRSKPRLAIEAEGILDITLADGSPFRLVGYADRIEIGPTGSVTLIDYKTGQAPSLREVLVGFAPQLTLEAAMAERGAFAALGPIEGVEGALYVKFGAGEVVDLRDLVFKDRAFADVVAEHFEGMVTLLSSFRNPAVGYLARPYPQFAARYNAYDHLSRVKEWSATGGAGAEDGG